MVAALRKMASNAALAGAALNKTITTYNPPVRGIYLYIDNIAPTPLIENRRARVYFTIENVTSQSITGVVRATIRAKHSIDPIFGEFLFPMDGLGPEQALDGVISFTCPRADLDNKLILEFLVKAPVPQGGEDYGATEVAASTSMQFDVGARFSVTMQDIIIRDTASHHEDTLLVSIGGSKDGRQWANSAWVGDHNNTDRGGFHPELGEYSRFDA